jgi:hypothetical protein
MRALALLLLLALAASAQPVDLIIVAGQSNAVGFDADPTKLTAEPADKDIRFWWRCGDPPPDDSDSRSQGWTHLQAQPLGSPQRKDAKKRQYGNFAKPSGGFGPEISMARALQKEGPVAVVKAAFSGTALRTDWDPRATDQNGACYRALVSEVKAAMAAAKEAGVVLRPRAFVWVQGESDANAQDAPRYVDRLTAMITAFRAEIEIPELKALIGVNTAFQEGRNTFMPAIVTAQQEVANTLAHCRYVDCSGTTHANAAHFDTAGTLEIGQRFAAALRAMENAR